MTNDKSLPTFTFDKAHGSIPDHMDGLAKIPGGVHKIRVGKDGSILSDRIELSLKDLGLGKGKVSY